jgi:hypothetical protein
MTISITIKNVTAKLHSALPQECHKQHNVTQHHNKKYDTQHNDVQHNNKKYDTHHNDEQHNDTQYHH